VKRFVLLAWVLAALPSVVRAQLPVGSEFQVNTYTTNVQWNSWVASDADGNFVVVWASDVQDGSWNGIFGQRFSAAGIALGAEFPINVHTTGNQIDPVVASDADGDFVVAWGSDGPDGSGSGVFGRRFNASGTVRGMEFQINSYTTGFQGRPAVALDAMGNFVVVWSSNGQDGSGYGVFGQRFDAAGVAQGSEFQVNSYTTYLQGEVAVASDDLGNIFVVWRRDGPIQGIFGQRYDTGGAAQGSEFRVNPLSGGGIQPSVASDRVGNFVVAWAGAYDGGGSGLRGRRFDASGASLGDDFSINTYTTGHQVMPVVACDARGNFVVVWISSGQDGSGFGGFGQRFTSVGLPKGTEFQVAPHTMNNQNVPVVASSAAGNFVVVWQDDYPGSNYNILGQRYGDLVFADGFEDGAVLRP
jgi:hypothetical protein